MPRQYRINPAILRERQNVVLDQIASGENDHESSIAGNAASLHPNHVTAFLCASGNKKAAAVRDSWGFHQPVTIMDSAELDAAIGRTYTVFTGRETELRNV